MNLDIQTLQLRYLTKDGTLTNINPQDKIYLKTTYCPTSPESENNPVIWVKARIKSFSHHSVIIQNPQIIQNPSEDNSQTILPSEDPTDVQKKFRNRELQIFKAGFWAIIPQNTSSGLSKYSHKELDVKLDFSNHVSQPQTGIDLAIVKKATKDLKASPLQRKNVDEFFMKITTAKLDVLSLNELLQSLALKQNINSQIASALYTLNIISTAAAIPLSQPQTGPPSKPWLESDNNIIESLVTIASELVAFINSQDLSEEVELTDDPEFDQDAFSEKLEIILAKLSQLSQATRSELQQLPSTPTDLSLNDNQSTILQLESQTEASSDTTDSSHTHIDVQNTSNNVEHQHIQHVQGINQDTILKQMQILNQQQQQVQALLQQASTMYANQNEQNANLPQTVRKVVINEIRNEVNPIREKLNKFEKQNQVNSNHPISSAQANANNSFSIPSHSTQVPLQTTMQQTQPNSLPAMQPPTTSQPTFTFGPSTPFSNQILQQTPIPNATQSSNTHNQYQTSHAPFAPYQETPLPTEILSYAADSKEDLSNLQSIQWLFFQILNSPELLSYEKLSPINLVSNARDNLIFALHIFKIHNHTLEGRDSWNKTSSSISKTGSMSISTIVQNLPSISKLVSDNMIHQHLRQAINILITHLKNLISTFDKTSKQNQTHLLEQTYGTNIVKSRNIDLMWNSIPTFSGIETETSVSWLFFITAISKVPEIFQLNKADCLLKLLSKILMPARAAIQDSQLTNNSTPKDILEKLKLIYGTPTKVVMQVINQHLQEGAFSALENSFPAKFKALSTHLNLIEHLDAYMKTVPNRHEFLTILHMPHHANDLLKLLTPQMQYNTNMALINSGKQAFQLSHMTSGQEMYEFFKLSIQIASSEGQVQLSLQPTSFQALHINNKNDQGDTDPTKDPSTDESSGAPNHSGRRSPTFRNRNGSRHIKQDQSNKNQQEPICRFCDAIAQNGFQSADGNFDIQNGQHHKYKKEIMFPEYCYKFMKLSFSDRSKLLEFLKMCTDCATTHGSHMNCREKFRQRKNRIKAQLQCLGTVDSQSCPKHWIMCDQHLTQNKQTEEQFCKAQKWKIHHPKVQDIQQSILLHFQHTQLGPTQVHLQSPRQPKLLFSSTNNLNTQSELNLQPENKSKKILFSFKIRSFTNNPITVLVDEGSTKSVINKRAIPMVGATQTNSRTMISGIANNSLAGTSPIVSMKLFSSFNNRWNIIEVKPAVLNRITEMPKEDLTTKIKNLLDFLSQNHTQFMKRYQHIFQLKHFHTFNEGGDIDVLLGSDVISSHPKILLTIENGPKIAMIRQEVYEEKFLTFAGPTEVLQTSPPPSIEYNMDPAMELKQDQEKQYRIHTNHCVNHMHDIEEEDEDHDQIETSNHNIETQIEEESPNEETNKHDHATSTTSEIESSPASPPTQQRKPKPGDVVRCEYELTVQGSNFKDNSKNAPFPYKFTMGKNQVIPGLEELVSTLIVGQEVSATIHHSKAYGNSGVPEAIPPRATIYCKAKLLEINPKGENENNNDHLTETTCALTTSHNQNSRTEEAAIEQTVIDKVFSDIIQTHFLDPLSLKTNQT